MNRFRFCPILLQCDDFRSIEIGPTCFYVVLMVEGSEWTDIAIDNAMRRNKNEVKKRLV